MAKFFSKELKRRRKLAGLTLPELGKKAGISGTQVHRLEAGYYKPNLTTARALARALRCKVDDLGEP